MQSRSENWKFGGNSSYCEIRREWYERHEPVVERWLAEMETAQDPWWRSAEHAAFCLVSCLEFKMGDRPGPPSWDDFEVEDFLFTDLSEGGTVGFFGSVEIFFHQLIESLRRFCVAEIIDPEVCRKWTDEMLDAQADFLRYYDEDTDELESAQIRCRRLGRPMPVPWKGERCSPIPVVAPNRHERRVARAERRRARRRSSRAGRR